MRRFHLSALGFGIVVGTMAFVGYRGSRASRITLEAWPAREGALDPEIEALVAERLATLTLEEKVGQTIQAEIGSFRPEDFGRWPLGSVLVGGNGGPNGLERAPAEAWAAMTARYRAAARDGVPPLLGIDAVHGHNNVVGAIIFPHNIGLGAAGDPELARRVARATAEEVAATGRRRAVRGDVAVRVAVGGRERPIPRRLRPGWELRCLGRS